MSALRNDAGTISTLVRRDVLLFAKQPGAEFAGQCNARFVAFQNYMNHPGPAQLIESIADRGTGGFLRITLP